MGLSSDEAWLCMPCPVASTGYILCDDCGTAKDWKDWRFKCGNENHKFYEYPAEDLDFIHALGSAMSLKAHMLRELETHGLVVGQCFICCT
ncbi:hypothetical protein GLOIN_2v1482221 [Rhizophagus irregularis DAOM 181602=DAOM 197198]|nr:hypothetical protein GLOIN_2v1482221 [Rhizophagus irregularis DAOM 181602=DAOM 197198]